MPLYAYKCPSCGHRFEELVRMEQRETVRCPECGSEATRAWDAPGVFGVKFSPECGREGCACESGCPHACHRR